MQNVVGGSRTGVNILQNQGKLFPVFKRELRHYLKAVFHYFPLHIGQGAKVLFRGRFVCKTSFILQTFKSFAYKWETLPQTIKRGKLFPIEKRGILRNIHPCSRMIGFPLVNARNQTFATSLHTCAPTNEKQEVRQ
jgi:hypothetical protein